MNSINIIGRLGRDPEVKTTNSGKSVASFSIAVNSGYGQNKTTMWFDCVAWEKTAEFIGNWFHKGDSIAISGKLSSRKYTGKDGANKTAVEIICSDVGFASAKAADGVTKNEEPKYQPAEITALDDDDSDLPF